MDFFKNGGGDNCRSYAGGTQVSVDKLGWSPGTTGCLFGPVVLVGPFNCPIESPGLQLGGALMKGSHVTLKYASTTSVVMEQLIRLMIHCVCLRATSTSPIAATGQWAT